MAARPQSSSLGSRLRGRTTLALWVVAALLAAALTAALLLQRGERDDVSGYIRDVNEAQATFALRYGSINRAYERFRLSPAAVESQLPGLRRAARAMTTIRRSVAEIEAPEPAAELRRRLIAFLAMQEAVGYELVAVAEYLPRLETAERPIARANARLASALQGARTIEAQGDAVGRYARELTAVAELLSAIEPPALLAPSHDAYVTQLRRYAGSSAALERAVASGDRDAIAEATVQLREASEAPTGTARAQKRAIEAYNKRVERIKELGLAVEEERQRLDRELG
jgi:hypothetical protein